MNGERTDRHHAVYGLLTLAAAIIVLMATVLTGAYAWSQTHVVTRTCFVESKDRTTPPTIRIMNTSMRVYTRDCGTLVVTDSIVDGRFGSADVYASIKRQETYEFTLRGRRIPLMSMFPNIITAKPVEG